MEATSQPMSVESLGHRGEQRHAMRGSGPLGRIAGAARHVGFLGGPRPPSAPSCRPRGGMRRRACDDRRHAVAAAFRGAPPEPWHKRARWVARSATATPCVPTASRAAFIKMK
jgi:hypothetical protein